MTSSTKSSALRADAAATIGPGNWIDGQPGGPGFVRIADNSGDSHGKHAESGDRTWGVAWDRSCAGPVTAQSRISGCCKLSIHQDPCVTSIARCSLLD